ncbi:MAG: 3'-5' exonuclease [Stellaceae bacterium]
MSGFGVVFQEVNLFPWLTIERNTALPLELRSMPKALRRERVNHLLELVGIAGFEKRWPRELSGGMRQRAARARAILRAQHLAHGGAIRRARCPDARHNESRAATHLARNTQDRSLCDALDRGGRVSRQPRHSDVVATGPNPDTNRQLDRALYHTVLDLTGQPRADVFTHQGRVVIIRLMREAARLAANPGAVAWLDAMSQVTGEILCRADYIDATQAGLFFASVQEMKADMRRQNVDTANLTIDDLGLFASPSRALRLSTIHYAKGREYAAVAMIGLRQGSFPHFRAEDVEAEKRLFYVGVTRAERILMYVAERDNWNNPPSPFLGRDGVNVV